MLFKPTQQKEILHIADLMCNTFLKKGYVYKAREVNDNFKLTFHIYLNEVFDYLSFLGYHSHYRQLLMVGRW
jgi:hypothetical protein